MAQIWWSSNDCHKSMHWLVWKKLCRAKQDGGLKFRKIEAFNTTLLAKHLRRIIDNRSPFLQRSLKDVIFINLIRWIKVNHTHHLLDGRVFSRLDLWFEKGSLNVLDPEPPYLYGMIPGFRLNTRGMPLVKP